MRLSTLIFITFFCVGCNAQKPVHLTYSHGAVVRGDTSKKELSLVFTADEFGEGLPAIIKTLKQQGIKGSFFLTGRFFRNGSFQNNIRKLANDGHYLGPHSDEHLLYCDWNKRDSLLVNKEVFETDIRKNLQAMQALHLPVYTPHFFIPPYEWWNDSIAKWSKEINLALFNFSPGIRTAVDYTWPELSSYKSSQWIVDHLRETIARKPMVINGSIILVHAGTDPRRTDKLYNRLGEIITLLKQNGYSFKRIDELLVSD